MLNITSDQGNANQNHTKISPHTCQNDYHQKEHEKMLNLISYQRNANQNCNETPLYIHWGGYKFKILIKKCE